MTVSWMDEAACAGAPLGWFDRGSTEQEQTLGVALCAQCPVRAECLAAAGRHERYWTIRGGELPTSARDRSTPLLLTVDEALRTCGTAAGYRRHLRAGETPCVPCEEAEWTYRQERRAQRLADRAGAMS